MATGEHVEEHHGFVLKEGIRRLKLTWEICFFLMVYICEGKKTKASLHYIPRQKWAPEGPGVCPAGGPAAKPSGSSTAEPAPEAAGKPVR